MKKLLRIAAMLLLLCLLTGCGNKQDRYADIPNPVATITMTDGSRMRIELFLADAPNTVANFVELANSGFYDGMLFSRIVPGVLIQTGDTAGDGTGNAGYTIKGEFSENGIVNDVSHTRGTISMCRQASDKNSASCQFFIMQGSYPEYDGKYAAFGRIADEESLNTLDAIASTSVDGSYRPVGMTTGIQTIRVETWDYQYESIKIELPKE